MMQVTNKLNLDVSSEPKAPSTNPANGSDRGFSSLLDNQNSATSPTATSTSQAEARAQASAHAEKNRAKSENKAASAEEATRQDELSAAAPSDSEPVVETEDSREEVERSDASETKAEEDADAAPSGDPALSGIDFLQHLQSSLNTNTELTTEADGLTSEAQLAKSEAANGGNALPLDAGSSAASASDADDELLTDEQLAARGKTGATTDDG